MNLPQPENAETDTIREVAAINNVQINGKESEPWIVVDQPKDKIRITISNRKLYRALHCKNIIQNGLDVLLVDKIKELLQKLAEGEIEKEKEIKELEAENGAEIREHKPAKRDDTGAGQGGVKAGGSEFA